MSMETALYSQLVFQVSRPSDYMIYYTCIFVTPVHVCELYADMLSICESTCANAAWPVTVMLPREHRNSK